jgi:tetratricopeptide (TPR) repeat protein
MVRRFGRPLSMRPLSLRPFSVRPLSTRSLLTMVAMFLALAMASSAFAQAGGTIRGVVRDDKGQPIEGAQVTIRMPDTGRSFTVKTNRRGEYLQIGLATGAYEVFAEKEKLKSPTDKVSTRMGATANVDLVLGVAAAAAGADMDAKRAALSKAFEEGVALSNSGNHDAAIAKFQEGLAVNPNCGDCYTNIGYSHMQKKEYDQAEAAYKKATEVAPNDASGWNGLANLYNAQRKFDLAAEASSKAAQMSGGAAGAAGGGNADALYNQGVILWNAGKIPEAKKQFEAAVAADANHAEAHFQLGMALVNEGNLAGAATEFETYLKLSPSGQNAATAKSLLAQVKK